MENAAEKSEFNDISFLDPVNPDLVNLSNQLDSSLRIGQNNVLPGSLSQPMSVEEKVNAGIFGNGEDLPQPVMREIQVKSIFRLASEVVKTFYQMILPTDHALY